MLGLIGAFLVATAGADAVPVQPEDVPIGRLIKNLEAHLEKHHDQANAHYTLARIHYLAFSFKAASIFVWTSNDEPLPRLAAPTVKTPERGQEDWWLRTKADYSEELLLYHALSAMSSFGNALGRDPENGLYWLGYASLLESIWKWKFGKDPAKYPALIRTIRVPQVREAYTWAFHLTRGEDANRRYRFPEEGIVSYEAANGLVRLEKASSAALSADEELALKLAKKTIARVEQLPVRPGPISPMVFSLQPNVRRLDDLLSPERPVQFDLRGHGVKETWPWMKPELALLVWDPERTNSITSGRQLFGTYTFQLFWKNGYHALGAIDDDHNGWLEGTELEGMAAWFDTNSDGQSAPEEVTPLSALGVTRIACAQDGMDGPHPTNAQGIWFKDGRILRTWDWMAKPLRQTPVDSNPTSATRIISQ